MASKKPARDPFAYFTGGEDLNVSDLSSDEEEDESATKEKSDKEKTPSFISKSEKKGSETEALPAPGILFEQVKKPTFLKDRTKKEIDWDRAVKDDTKPEEDVCITNTHSIPPPKSYEQQTDALKPTLGGAEEEEEESEPRRVVGSVTSAFIRAVKRAAPQQSDSDGETKKNRTQLS